MALGFSRQAIPWSKPTCPRCSQRDADPILLGYPEEGHICGECWKIDRLNETMPYGPALTLTSQEETPMSQLADWKCHKIVKAGKIIDLPPIHDRNLIGNQMIVVEGANGEPARVEMPENAFSRGWPQVGDYIVIYSEDGYKSWSPAKAFENGYTLA